MALLALKAERPAHSDLALQDLAVGTQSRGVCDRSVWVRGIGCHHFKLKQLMDEGRSAGDGSAVRILQPPFGTTSPSLFQDVLEVNLGAWAVLGKVDDDVGTFAGCY